MIVGKPETVNAYITTDLSKNITQEYGLKNVSLQSENITITPRVKVTLTGESRAFHIEPISPNSDMVQPIIGDNTTTWSWQVTPLESGNHTLFLSVEYVVPLNDHDYQDYKTLKDVEEVINVESNYRYYSELIWQSGINNIGYIDWGFWQVIIGIFCSVLALCSLLISIYSVRRPQTPINTQDNTQPQGNTTNQIVSQESQEKDMSNSSAVVTDNTPTGENETTTPADVKRTTTK